MSKGTQEKRGPSQKRRLVRKGKNAIVLARVSSPPDSGMSLIRSFNRPPRTVGIPFDELPEDGCRWMFNGPGNMCCGEQIIPGTPYCEKHSAIVHRPPQPNEIQLLQDAAK